MHKTWNIYAYSRFHIIISLWIPNLVNCDTLSFASSRFSLYSTIFFYFNQKKVLYNCVVRWTEHKLRFRKMFWVQLRQLMWKNFLIRTRSKVSHCSHLLLIKFWKYLEILHVILCVLQIRVIIELVWPLILFVILALVRYVHTHMHCLFTWSTVY